MNLKATLTALLSLAFLPAVSQAEPLAVGAPAPEVSGVDQNGKTVNFKDVYAKGPTLVYFYPKADTPGCTTEACELRDQNEAIAAADTVILGISPDSVKAPAKFKTKFGLPYQLLADTEHAVAQAYGVWVEKSMYGKKYMGVERSTFLIDGKGVLRREWRKVKVPGHAEEVLAAAAAL